MWQTHTCFKSCKSTADCLLGYEDDDRPECTKATKDDGLFCAFPSTPCENYVKLEDECPGGDYTMCINWSTVFLAIFLSNILQLIFEASLLYSLEVQFTATPLERLQHPERYNDNNGDGSGGTDDSNPDQKKELDCGRVLSKCFGEIAFIGSYIGVILAMVVGMTYSIKYGRPLTIMVEFFIAWAFDQLKSIPVQFCIYWVIIRRFGYYENVNLETWDDEAIAERGPDISLLYLMRKNVAEFLEQQRVVNFILGMVILLCIVIFSELALSQQIDQI